VCACVRVVRVQRKPRSMSLRNHCKGAAAAAITGQEPGWGAKLLYEPAEPWQPLSHGGRQTNPAAMVSTAAAEFAPRHRFANRFSRETCEALSKLAFFRLGLQVSERHRLLVLKRDGSAEAAKTLAVHASPYPNL
jgi:hypothetical protein